MLAVHHARTDYAEGGLTNLDDLTPACGWDNRLVDTQGGYTTTINGHNDIEWHPPPDLDHGQSRINYYHRPELLLPEHTEQQPEWDDLDHTPVTIDLHWITEMTEALQYMATDHHHGGTGTRGP